MINNFTIAHRHRGYDRYTVFSYFGCVMSFVFLFPLVGCSDYTLQESEKYPSGANPIIEVSPKTLYFDIDEPGTTEIQNFQISNVGDSILEISEMAIVGDEPFSITNVSGLQYLEPFQEIDVAVTYAPNEVGKVHSGAVLVFSNDPYESGVEVTLGGMVKQPLLTAEPYILDLGITPIDEELTGVFTLKSVGDTPVTITSIDMSGGLFSFDESFSLPRTMAPGEEYNLEVSFASSAGGLFSEDITFDTKEPAFDVTTKIIAEAQEGLPIAVCDVDPPDIQPNGGSATWYGSDSYDEEGFSILYHTWTLISKPGGSTATIPSGGANRPNFMPDLAGEYTAELIVTNELGIVSAPCTTTLEAIPGQDLWVQMYWSNPGDDMDLHLLRGNGTLNSPDDCYYGNCQGGILDWGIPNDPSDNPSLDLDDINGTGPENINISNPEAGNFTVVVHDYPGNSFTPGNQVTVVIYAGGSMVWSATKTISGEDTETPFARIAWPSGTVTGL